MVKQITSLQNSFIKQLVQVSEKSRNRKQSGIFLIEGKRELSLAIKGNYTIDTLLFYPDLFSESEAKALSHYAIDIIEISKEVFEKLAYRKSTGGIIAIAKSKEHSLNNLNLTSENPLILVAEAPEKPGNIGALLRTSDAANLDAIIIANPKTDLYNPNIIRSSVGCIFTNIIAMGSTSEIITFLEENDFNIYCGSLQGAVEYHTQDFTKPTAIVVGTEADGLTDSWQAHATQNIIIPMQGEIDSMNVSVAAGILIFEAKRQRQFK